MFLGYQEKDGVKFISGVANTREELENNEFIKYSDIKETKDKYVLVDGKYITETQAFEKNKEKKRAEINAARDAAEQGGFFYMGKTFDSDVVSCIRIQGAAQSMQAASMVEDVPSITWTCKDNTTIELTAQELLGLSVALAEWSNTCHKKATKLKAQIELANTQEELEKITWNA